MYTFSKAGAFDHAWKRFKERPFFLMGVFVLSAVLLSISGYFAERSGTGSAVLATNIIDFVLSIVLSMGVTQITLRIHDGVDTHYPDLFEPLALFWKYLAVTVLTGVIVLIGLLLFIIPGIIAALAISFAPYLVIDKKMGPIEALHESIRITHGHRWNLFVFSVLLLAVNVLGALFLGLGLLITVPVSALALVYVYRWLLTPDEARAVRVSLLSKVIASIVVVCACIAAIGGIFALSTQQPSESTTPTAQSMELERAQQRDAQRYAAVDAIARAASRYYEQYDRYPTMLSELVPAYLPSVPTDPVTAEPYAYSAYAPELDFEVCAFLEVDPAGIVCEYGLDDDAYAGHSDDEALPESDDAANFDDDEVVWPPQGGFE